MVEEIKDASTDMNEKECEVEKCCVDEREQARKSRGHQVRHCVKERRNGL